VSLAVSSEDTLWSEGAQLLGSQSTVTKNADDDAVSLGLGSGLEFVDLMAVEDIEDPSGKLGQWRTRNLAFAFVFAPLEESPNPSGVGVNRCLCQRSPVFATGFQEMDGKGVNAPLIELGQLGYAVLVAPRQEDVPQWITVAAVDG
jgi:hypothetical protein